MSYKAKIAARQRTERKPVDPLGHIKGLKFPVFKMQQGDHTFYMGALDARQLKPVSFVEVLTEENPNGEQRDETLSHVNKIRRDITAGALITDALTVYLVNGARVIETPQGIFVTTPSEHGEYLRITNGQSRTAAAHKAIIEDGFDKPFQYSLSCIPFISDEDVQRQRAEMTTSGKREPTALAVYLLYKVGKLPAHQTVACELALRANGDEKSRLFDRVRYLNRQGKKSGGRVPIQDFAKIIGDWIRTTPEFAALSRDDQYSILDMALSTWHDCNKAAWDDQVGYVLGRPFGIKGILLCMPAVCRKAIQKHGSLDAVTVGITIEAASKALDPSGTKVPYVASSYGNDGQSLQSFKAKVFNKLYIVSDEPGPDGAKKMERMDDPRARKS